MAVQLDMAVAPPDLFGIDLFGFDLVTPAPPDLSGGDLAVPPNTVSAANSTISFAPTSPIANGNSSSVITVTVKDGANAPMAGKTVSLAVSGTNNTLVQPASPTGANGVATGTITSTQAETKTVTATVDGTMFSNTITFAPQVAHSLVFSTPPGAKVNNALPTLAVTALDMDSQLVTGTTTLITLDLMIPDTGNPGQYKLAPGGSMTGPNAQNTVNGVAQFSGLTIPVAMTGYELRASATGCPPVFSSPFEVTAMTVATPGNVMAAVQNTSSINISWDAVSGVAKYNVYRYPPPTGQAGPYDQVFTVNVPTLNYLDKNLKHGTYSYKVDAEDGTGLKSATSAFVSASAGRELCIMDGVTTPTYTGLVVIPAQTGTFNYPPLRTITATAFVNPISMAVDLTNNLIYVANSGDSTSTTEPVHVFNRTDNSLAGTVTPKTTFNIASPAGTGTKPVLHQIALDPVNNEFVVVESNTPSIIAYNVNNTAAPVWTISGSNVTGPLSIPWGVALYNHGGDTEIYITSVTSGGIASVNKYLRSTVVANLTAGNYNAAPLVVVTATGVNPSKSLSAPRNLFVYHGPASGTPPPVVGDALYVANSTTGSTSLGYGSVSWYSLPITSGGALPVAGQFPIGTALKTYGVVVDPAADTLYPLLGGTANNIIPVTNSDGTVTPANITVSGGSLGGPTDIAFCN